MELVSSGCLVPLVPLVPPRGSALWGGLDIPELDFRKERPPFKGCLGGQMYRLSTSLQGQTGPAWGLCLGMAN